MENKKVIVITDPEDGWDCVRHVFWNIKSAVEYYNVDYIEGKDDFAEYSELENLISTEIIVK